MNAQDRELYDALLRRHQQLATSVALLKSDLAYFRTRLDAPEPLSAAPVLPPLPVIPEPVAPVTPPPIPASAPVSKIPPLAEAGSLAGDGHRPPLQGEGVPSPRVEKETPPLGLEFQFGRWLARIGVVFALITVISFSVLVHDAIYQHMGPWSKLGVLAAVSGGLIAGGFWLERRNRDMIVYARTLAGGGLACLYYTLYGATYVEQLRVIPSPFFGGLLLLAWSAWVLWLAETRKSELLSVFAIALAYFSSAITPVGGFTMVSNLILAATAVIFLIRNSWTGLSYLCLIGTYAGFLRQIVANRADAPFDFQLLHVVDFWPLAIYLGGAWLIFSAGIFLAKTDAFVEGNRMAFLCLNNGAFAGLLVVASQLSGYGHIGGLFLTCGAVFLAASGLAKVTRSTEADLSGAYLMQGLALGTGGIVISYTGVTRGLMLVIESVFLAAAGSYANNLILRIGACLVAALGTFYLGAEIVDGGHFPWVLTFGGALAMLVNAGLARRDLWKTPPEAQRFVVSSAFYSLLALGLLGLGICLNAHDDWVAPDLAGLALLLTFAIYAVPLFELPPLSQLLLVLAQALAFVPPLIGVAGSMEESRGELVAIATMILVTWWPRQKLIRTTGWLQPMLILYAPAMVAFGYNLVHPHLSAQGWMIGASLLSLAFLAYGIWSRTWPFAIAGQIFLVLAVDTFLNLSDATGRFPWAWWAALVPPVVVYFTGWLTQAWLPTRIADEALRGFIRIVGRAYQVIAVGLTIRWIFGVVPDAYLTLTFFGVATALLLVNTRWPSSFGARTAFVFDLVGVVSYLNPYWAPPMYAFTWPVTAGFLLFLAQPAILRRGGALLVSEAESWLVVLASTVMAWLCVSNGVTAMGSHNLTLAWALYAVVLLGIGFAAGERRQRWCGLAVLVAAMIRVAVYDFWHLTELYKMLTFLALTVICLGLSFLYYKFGDKVKAWL